ncbi:putative adhesion G protein-coupled receptor E4P [Centruroides vittatus]|uniref:putative adhesion G protein-coupled receptor E4P n=1 Tax=Centruroides vittatus TaxID=120091 RepID=UPI00350F1255
MRVVGFLTFLTVLINSSLQNEPVDGGWTKWSIMSDSECSKHCGGGKQKFVRTCTNPKPQNNGADCEGPSEKEEDCNTHTCEKEIEESPWEEWSACSRTCGLGTRERFRKCVHAKEGEFKCEKKEDVSYEMRNCTDWEPFVAYKCPDPCDKTSDEYKDVEKVRHCPDRAKCTNESTEMGPQRKCKCVMGYVLDAEEWKCKAPKPPEPTPRPIPTMDPVEKTVSIVVTRTASTVLLIMVGLTLALFLLLRIFTIDRIIQMNMEIALESAHLLLLIPPSVSEEEPMFCTMISVGLHFFFTACFMFMMLESLHVYSMVAFVVPRNGMLNRLQNTILGWGVSMFIILISVCFFLDQYGAEYHCWLEMHFPLVYLQYGPIITLCILDFLLLEAAGAANYKPLKVVDMKQLMSAKIHQRSNLIIMPLILSSWIIGMLSDYEQNLGLYSVYSILNTIIGVCIFVFHSLGNQEVRAKLKKFFKCCVR